MHLYRQVDEKASGIVNDLLTHNDLDQEFLDIRGLKVVGSSNPDYYKSYDYVGIAHRLEDIAEKERNEGHDEATGYLRKTAFEIRTLNETLDIIMK